MFLVYLLKNENKSYIGYTNDFKRRLRQHNGEIKGGAKYTSKYDNWSPICIVDGFQTKSEAMQCEWRLKRVKGYYKRLKYLSQILQKNKKWTKNSPLISSQNLSIYVTDQFKHLFPCETKELVWF